ncbi:MAG: hypothetical protein R2703_15170 [Micropruina glycogenica]
MRRTVAAVAAVAAVLLAGCVPQTPPSPTPSPTPTFMCTPEAGGTGSPCAEQVPEDEGQSALYAEANRSTAPIRQVSEGRIELSGADQLTPELKVVVGSDDVEAIVAELKNFKNKTI